MAAGPPDDKLRPRYGYALEASMAWASAWAAAAGVVVASDSGYLRWVLRIVSG